MISFFRSTTLREISRLPEDDIDSQGLGAAVRPSRYDGNGAVVVPCNCVQQCDPNALGECGGRLPALHWIKRGAAGART